MNERTSRVEQVSALLICRDPAAIKLRKIQKTVLYRQPEERLGEKTRQVATKVRERYNKIWKEKVGISRWKEQRRDTYLATAVTRREINEADPLCGGQLFSTAIADDLFEKRDNKFGN